MDPLSAYIPADRRRALARGEDLPDRALGAVMVADISGFTPLTEALALRLGPRRGAEELARRLDAVYEALIARVDARGGSVVGFSGDAIACWFGPDSPDEHAAASAAAGALELQATMTSLVGERDEAFAGLALKVAVAAGPVRRFLVGDPEVQLLDALAGRTMTRVAAAEHLAGRGEIVVDEPTLGLLGDGAAAAWREDPATGERFAVLAGDLGPPHGTFPPEPPEPLDPRVARAWVLPAVSERLRAGQGDFITELRPAGALFLRFDGIEYDDDPDAGRKLDDYVRWVQRTLGRYDGTLVQLTIGDKGSYLYAAFGAPNAHGDDARRAALAARDLRVAPPELAFLAPPRIGLSWGTMRTGAYGSSTRRTYGVLGDETNLAARLMQAAEPGQAIASRRLAEATARVLAWTPLVPVAVKGKAEPVPVFQLEAAPTDAASSSVGSLIGREAERAAVASAARALAGGRGGILVVEGDLGMGKSRLIEELRREATALGALILAGAGDAVERATPYHAWRSPLERALGIEGLTDADARRHQALAAVGPDRAGLAPLLDAIAPLDLPDSDVTRHLSGPARVASTHELVAEVLRDVARRAPVVLALDDVHWLDSASWALAAAVERRTRELPFLLVVSVRPADLPAELDGLGGAANATRLRLEPLAADEAAALAARRLGAAELPAAVASLIARLAEGNPFFVEELATALREAGLVEVVDGRCRVPRGVDLRTADLPDTVQGVITGRIDRLEAPQQLTLKLASVVGRSFEVPTLRAVHPVEADRERLADHLGALERADLVLLERPEPDGAYAFRHATTQEVAYNLMLFAQRRRLHRAIGEWLERAPASRLPEVLQRLALHWSRAVEGDESPDPQAVARAVDYLSQAAQGASRVGAYPEAIADLERALSLSARGGASRAALLVQLGQLHEKVSEFQRAAERLRAGLAEALEAGDPRTAADALTGLSWVATRQGDYAEARRAGDEAAALARQAGDAAATARAVSRLAILEAYGGDFAAAAARGKESLGLYRAAGDRAGVGTSLNNLGGFAIYAGDFDLAGRHFTAALEIAQSMGDRENMAKCLTNLGLAAEKRGDFVEATRRYEESLVVCREIAARQAGLINTLNLGDVAAATLDDAAAARRYAQVLAEAADLNALPQALGAVCGLALVRARAGDLTRAAELLGFALGHPASNADVRQQAQPARDTLASALAAAELVAAMERGSRRSLRSLIDEVTAPDAAG